MVEAGADSLLAFAAHQQMHRALSILKQGGVLSFDGPKVRAVRNVRQLTSNSLSAAEVAPTEIAHQAGPDKPALLIGQ